MNIDVVSVCNPDGKNFIFGQSHFIKTVEDMHEALVNAVPNIKFGLAFCEASGARLIRTSGTSDEMISLAVRNAQSVACGHTFFIFLGNAYPINVLNAIKILPEVVHIFCATSNPAEILITQTKLGRGVVGIIDGGSPKGVEGEKDKNERKKFLRNIGYKL